jgi:hypothetical protein
LSETKPLRVRVAEALGDDLGPCPAHFVCADEDEPSQWRCDCGATGSYGHPGPQCFAHDRPALRYDTDWSATGPLVEKHGIGVFMPDEYNRTDGEWIAVYGGVHGWDDGSVCADIDAFGPTPLIAVCNLLLALKEKGKI